DAAEGRGGRAQRRRLEVVGHVVATTTSCSPRAASASRRSSRKSNPVGENVGGYTARQIATSCSPTRSGLAFAISAAIPSTRLGTSLAFTTAKIWVAARISAGTVVAAIAGVRSAPKYMLRAITVTPSSARAGTANNRPPRSETGSRRFIANPPGVVGSDRASEKSAGDGQG